jgi:hypothetical protein
MFGWFFFLHHATLFSCNCRNQASLTMSARVKHFSSALQHALREERHFALDEGVAFPTVGSLVIRSGQDTRSDPCISSVLYFDHDYDFELPR